VTPDVTTAVAAFSIGVAFALFMTVFAQLIYGGLRTIREALGWGRIRV
jgi:hypothetical protein